MNVAGGEILHAEERAVPLTPGAGNVEALGEIGVGAAADADRLGKIHQPERGVERVDADVHAGTAAAQVRVDKARTGREPVAPGGVDARVIDLAQRAGV